MNIGISEIKLLPVRVRHWFIKRIIQKLEKSQENMQQNPNLDSKSRKVANNIDIDKVDKFFAKFGE